MVHHLWQEGGFVVYGCCWASLELSVLGWGPAELMTILYCSNFEAPLTWMGRILYLLL
jgi:hypothetical protein